MHQFVFAASESCSIPYCSLALAQLCFHGHRQAVKFIISAPGLKHICFIQIFDSSVMRKYIKLPIIPLLSLFLTPFINIGFRSSSNSTDGAITTSQLILSGGEGYINFRIGETLAVVPG